MTKCPLCGSTVAYLGFNFLECSTVDCSNGPKIDFEVPEGYKVGWYFDNDPVEGMVKRPFLKKED